MERPDISKYLVARPDRTMHRSLLFSPRADASLTKKERMRRLHDVWKRQREVMSEGALAEN